MTAQPRLQPVGDLETPQGPTVFVRTLSAPPGLPWDQARIAALEARVGAPLPLTEVLFQLRRLDPWAPGRAARYAACYVRAREIGEDFHSAVDVAGRSIPVRFRSPQARSREVRGLAAALAALGLAAGLIGGAATSALALREETAASLAGAEQMAALRLRAATAQERQRLQARTLNAVGVRRLEVKTVLADLAWAAAAKSPDAHIDAFHWDHGHMALEVRGAGAPFGFTTRKVLKAGKPLRANVWLWGVEPAGAGTSP